MTKAFSELLAAVALICGSGDDTQNCRKAHIQCAVSWVRAGLAKSETEGLQKSIEHFEYKSAKRGFQRQDVQPCTQIVDEIK